MELRSRADTLLGLAAAALTAWLFASAALGTPLQAGVSTFGRPPELAIAWVVAGGAAVWWLLRAPDRLALARRLTLVLLTSTLLGQRGVPGDGGCRLALLAVTLLAAQPWLASSRAALLTAAALALAVPGMLGTDFPQGSVLWLTYVLPPAALAWLVPSLFAGAQASRIVLVLLLGTAVLCTFALASYLQLAEGLAFPLAAVLPTRLRLLGLHPNLAVPHLVTTLVLAAGLIASAPGRLRPLLALAALPVLAALFALRSRTGLLAFGFGGGLLALAWLQVRSSARLPALRWLPAIAAVAVAALLIWPALPTGSRDALAPNPSMVTKAVSFRASMWELGRAASSAAPWYGFGPGTTHLQAALARPGIFEGLPKDDHPHNVVLAVGAALGWPGLLGLALLFLGGVMDTRRGTPLWHAAGAALLALWAANAIDLGGADATLYPAFVFLLLGLRQAGGHEGEPASASPAAASDAHAASAATSPSVPVRAAMPGRAASSPRVPRAAAAAPWLAAALALAGIALSLGDALERRADAALVAAEAERRSALIAGGLPAPSRAGDGDPLHAWLAWASRLQPFDPNLPLLRARLASLRQRPAETLTALLEARALYPGSAQLAHQSALVLAAQSPDDPRVEAWLAEAVRLDPYGPESWRRHLDHARCLSRLRRSDDALQALLASVLLNPAAAAELPRTGTGRSITLQPGGPGAPVISLQALLTALAARRAAARDVDGDEALRLRMREVELLHGLGELQAAEEAAKTLLADNPTYMRIRFAQSAHDAGRYAEAIEQLRPLAEQRGFGTHGDLLDALSRVTPLDAGAFDTQLQVVTALMAQGRDVVFELTTLQRVLEARQRCAERLGDLSLAVQLSDARAFAQR